MQIREAVAAAHVGLLEVFPEMKEKELRLEGVEKTDDGRYWQVTLSYAIAGATWDGPISRSYKTVKLRNEDGELMGARNGFLFDAA